MILKLRVQFLLLALGERKSGGREGEIKIRFLNVLVRAVKSFIV